MIRGIDWGGYLSATNESAIPFDDLVKAGLCDFFVTKGAQDVPYINSVKCIEWARAAGVPVVGAYYWHYPAWDRKAQLAEYIKAAKQENPDFLALDMEQAQGQTSKTISDSARYICEGLRQAFPGKPVFIYTGDNYIDVNAPDCNSWMGGFHRWIASWPDWGVKHPVPTNYLSFDEIKTYPLDWWKPALPDAWGAGWDIWQFGTWQRPEGYGWPYDHQYDWNLYKGSLDDLRKMCGLEPAVTPPPAELTDKQKLDILWSEHLKGQ